VDLSALVVTWNSVDDVADCLDAALAQEDVGLEVVVVDNASTDGTREVLARYSSHPKVRILLQEQNLGYAAANNLAASHAAGRYLLLLNPDCEMAPDCSRRLLDHLEDQPGCGAAAAVLSYPDGRPQSFLRRDVSFPVAFWAFLESARRVDLKWRGGKHQAHRIYSELDGVVLTEPMAVDCPAAACVAVPRSVVTTELFDPLLPLFFNDAELYRRLRLRSYTVDLVPTARAAHRYGASVAIVPSERRRAETVASLRRYVSPAWSMVACSTLWLLLAIDALVCLTFPQTRAVGRGTLGGLGWRGAPTPWLSAIPPAVPRLRGMWWRLKGSPFRGLNAVSRRSRRWRFCLSARLGARLSGCSLQLHVSKDADLPRRFRFEFVRGRTASLTIGRGVLCRPGLVLRLGGEVVLGDGCELRQDVMLNVKGRLVLTGRNVLGRGTMVHADTTMLWEWGATTGEYVSVLDSHHVMNGTLVHVFDQEVDVRPVVIGASSLLGAHSVVLPGCRIGRTSLVGAASVVTQDVSDGVRVVGVPARPLPGSAVVSQDPPAGRPQPSASRR
jgi:GT2 family glycosyltransferase/acetyltransferase-like isoleucine patch superfamily enzyme